LAANVVVAVEALAGLLGFALATGLLFARFSRPQAKVLFSNRAVVAPYRGVTGFMLRIANGRTSELSEVQATMLLVLRPKEGGRKFLPLTLERPKVAFLPLHWVIVHPIDEDSPLHGVTPAKIRELDGEVIVLLTAHDEATSQTVHTRSSYKPDEIVWDAKFADMFSGTENGIVTADLRRIHEIERVG
jgi:inward rectifier potassium channel